MTTVLITGGTGLIGTALTRALLEKGYEVIVLTRDPGKQTHKIEGVNYAKWDIVHQIIDKAAIARADHIIHLAGTGIADKRWTARRKKEIVSSRVKSGELLIKTLQEMPNQVKSVISASAIGWYGPDPELPNLRPFREEDPADNSFLGQTCLQWEQSLAGVEEMGKRRVTIRTGLVLSKKGGLLEEYRKPLRWGLATVLGSGKQILSWIYIDDLVRIYIQAIENEKMKGVYNAVAPVPVSNKELVLKYAELKKGKFFIPVYIPPYLLKMVLGEMSIEVLKSCTVSCARLHLEGFIFQYPSPEAVMKAL